MLVQQLVPKHNAHLEEKGPDKSVFLIEEGPKLPMTQTFGPTPDVLLRDAWNEGLDNPAYYDPEILGACTDANKYRKKRPPSLSVLPTYPATLTKIPPLRRWKLDFRSTPRSRPHDIQWGKFLAVVLLVCILLLLLTGVAVIAHMAVQTGLNFTDSWFRFEGSVSSAVDTQFRIINRNFTPDLQNSSSVSFMKLVAELKHSLDVIFMDSPLSNNYNVTEKFHFSNGSVIVHCRVVLKKPVPNAVHQIGIVFIEALEKGRGMLPPGIFYIDVHTIRFNVGNEDDRHFFIESFNDKIASWTEWTEWSSCLSNQGVCDGSRVRIRKRECRFESGDKSDVNRCVLKSGEDVVVQTKSCVCPVTPVLSPFTSPAFLESAFWSEWGDWSSCSDLLNRCDPRQVQRRFRTCHKKRDRTSDVDETLEFLPNAICTRRNGETSIELRLCICPTTSAIPYWPNRNGSSSTVSPLASVLLHRHQLLQHSRPKKWILRSLLVNKTTKSPEMLPETC